MREGRGAPPGWSLAVVLAVFGFGVVVATSSVTEARRAEEPRRDRLVALIQERRAAVDRLDERVQALRDDLVTAREQVTRLTAAQTAEQERLDAIAAMAGATPLEGPGLEVRLSDSDRPVPEGEDEGAYRVHDRDLQLVVNALFGAGAEAVAVNEVRIVATSPIRAAGDTIVVSFRPVSPPYVVSAIGAKRDAFSRTEIAALFERWHEVFGLGFRVSVRDDLTVPAFTGRLRVRQARPVAAAGDEVAG